jgi:DNA-binding NarL/FixJ family response regulator
MRIFLVCKDERLKLAVLMLIDNQPGMAVSGISDRLAGLAKQLETNLPDILVLEWPLSVVSLQNLMAEIQEIARPPEVIYLSNKPEMREAIIDTGVNHFVLTNAPPDDLLDTLKDLQSSVKEREAQKILKGDF